MADNNEQQPSVRANPALADAMNREGVRYADAGQHRISEHFYRAAHASCPAYLYASGNLILSLRNQGKSAEAVEFAEAEFENNKDKPWFLSCYINALMDQSKYKKALLLLEQLKGSDNYGKSAGFEFNYGRCLYETGRIHDAETHFRTSNQLEEGQYDYGWLTSCFKKLGRFAANESFMIEKLGSDRNNTKLSVLWRGYWLADYYENWAKSLENSEEELPALSKAKKYIEEALEATKSEGDNGLNEDNLAKANELLVRVDKRISHIENGFEVIPPWTPDSPAPD